MKFAKILIAALAVAMVGCNNTDDNYTPTPELIKVCVDAGTSADTSADTRTEFNGTEIKNRDDLSQALMKCRAGEKVKVTVFRFNRTLTSGEYETITFLLDAAQ